MKDKDPNEEEFNRDDQDNINEADDSFGLPDLDFNTLDDEPEEEEAAEPEAEPEATEEPADEPVADEPAAASVDESADSLSGELDSEVGSDDVVTDDAQEDIDDGESGGADDGGDGGGYVPPKPESNAPRIIAALVITILVSGAIWYFAFYRPQKAAEEKARIEQLRAEEAAKEAAAKKKAEEERLAAEQAANEAADEDEAASKEATFTTISEPTGRYYVVIASFIDADMAADLGIKLKADGVSSVLLSPKGSRKFNRLTLGDYSSWSEAQAEANKLKGEYGEGLWVLKF